MADPEVRGSEPPPLLRVSGLAKRFGSHEAVIDLSLSLGEGEFFCLLGPSGCGKSTLLRLIAGFERPDSGAIHLGFVDLAGMPPHRRPINMMFQSYALFPHMSVSRNIAYGLDGMRLSRSAVAEKVSDLLRLLRLDGFETRRPDQLSGGQRQRVALARALAREPKVLLLDEPLGALDRGLREETQGELRALQRRLGTTFVVVTHDPEEAMTLGDRIGVMDRGRLVQVGEPASLYERPASRFVAGLLGDVNLIEGRLGSAEGDLRIVETKLGPMRVAAADANLVEGEPVVIALRPERVTLAAPGMDGLPGTVSETTYLGDRLRHHVRMADGTILRASVPTTGAGSGRTGTGAAISLGFSPEAGVLLPA